MNDNATEKNGSGTLCAVGQTAVLDVTILSHPCSALLDMGASRSFVHPQMVKRFEVTTDGLSAPFQFTFANSSSLVFTQGVRNLAMWTHGVCVTGDFLIGPVPFEIVIGLDWLNDKRAQWDFYTNVLTIEVATNCHQLKPRRARLAALLGGAGERKSAADIAFEDFAADVARMRHADAAALARPANKRYKSFKNRFKRVPIKILIARARQNTQSQKSPKDLTATSMQCQNICRSNWGLPALRSRRL